MKRSSKLLSVFVLFLPLCLMAQRITVSGNKFVVGNKPIFMNGANTPWNNWNDFGGNYQSAWWNTEFKKIKDTGGNSTRIWITCNGMVGVNIEEDGTVTGASDAFWSNLDNLFQLALENKIYIKATLISFDHFKNANSYCQRWRNMVNSDVKVTSFVDNYAIPFVKRYNDNPYLWAVDVCNEIEWVNQNEECGNISWNRLQYLVARVASGVHENSQVLVTLGSAAIKWNSTACEGNYWSDSNLKARYKSDNAKLDFYSPHFYGWVVQWFGNFAKEKKPSSYAIDDRPCVIGENPGTGVYNDVANPKLTVKPEDMFLAANKNGWYGLMPWTSNGVDENGSLDDFKSGLLAFQHAYPGLVNTELAVGVNQINNHGRNLIKNVLLDKDISIELTDQGSARVSLTDIRGNVVSDNLVEEHVILIPANQLSKGIYLLTVVQGGISESRKVVVR